MRFSACAMLLPLPVAHAEPPWVAQREAADRAAPPAAAVSCAIPATSAGKHETTCEGIKTIYNVPARCVRGGDGVAASSCGVVMDIHGWTMTGQQQDNNTNMRALGEKHGYVVVQPSANGSPTSWTTADQKVVYALMMACVDEPAWDMDRAKVHFMGFSEGSEMTWSFIKKHSDVIASAVPMSCAAGSDAEACAAATPRVPVLFNQGTNDAMCDFSHAAATIDAYKKAWATGAGVVISSDAHHKRTRYTAADGAAVFDFLTFDYIANECIYTGKGHCFPGGQDDVCYGNKFAPGQLAAFSCPKNPREAAYSIGEEAMKWFIAHPKGAPPPARYHCDKDAATCAAAADGHATMAKCAAACGAPAPAPPAQAYACVIQSGAKQCTAVPPSIPGSFPSLAACQKECA